MTAAVGIAVQSFELVLAAYDTVKTNRDRLRGLVKRCEIVVDSLQLVVNERGEAYAGSLRIERLEQVFEYIASTMRCLGGRKWWHMLINSEKDNTTIQACHHLITDLIILFNLHELVDLRRWNRRHLQERRTEHGNILQAEERVESGQRILLSQMDWQNFTIARLACQVDRSMSTQRFRRRNSLPFNNSHCDSTRHPLGFLFPFRPAASAALAPDLKIAELPSPCTTPSVSSLQRVRSLSIPRYGTGFPSSCGGRHEQRDPQLSVLRSMASDNASRSSRATRSIRSTSTTSSTILLYNCDPWAHVEAPSERRVPLTFFTRPFDENDLQYLDSMLTDTHTRARRRHSTRSSVPFTTSAYLSRENRSCRSHSCSCAHPHSPSPSARSGYLGATDTVLWSNESGLHRATPTEMTESLASHRAVRASNSPTPLSDVASETFTLAQMLESTNAKARHPTTDSAPDRDSDMVAVHRSLPSPHQSPAPRWREHLETDSDDSEMKHSSIERSDTAVAKAIPHLVGEIIEVFFVSNVPDEGFILDHADKIGITTTSVLAEWTSSDNAAISGSATALRRPTGRLRQKPATAQGICVANVNDPVDEIDDCALHGVKRRTEIVVLRLAPAVNPYSILRSVSPRSGSTKSPKSPKRVVIVNSVEPIVLVSVVFHHNERQGQQQDSLSGTIPIWAIFSWPALTTVAMVKENIACLVANEMSRRAEVRCRTGCPSAPSEQGDAGDFPSSSVGDTTRRRPSLNFGFNLTRRLTSGSASHNSRSSPLSMSRRRTFFASSPFFHRHPPPSPTSHPNSEPRASRDLTRGPSPKPTCTPAVEGVNAQAPSSAKLDASHIVINLNTDESESEYAGYLLNSPTGSSIKHQQQVYRLGDAITLRQCAAILSGDFGLRPNSGIRAGAGRMGSEEDPEWDGVALPGNAHFCAEVHGYIHLH